MHQNYDHLWYRIILAVIGILCFISFLVFYWKHNLWFQLLTAAAYAVAEKKMYKCLRECLGCNSMYTHAHVHLHTLKHEPIHPPTHIH